MRQIILFSSTVIVFSSCSALDQFNDTFEDVGELGDTISNPDLGDIFGGSVKMVGVSPSSDYASNGAIDFSVLPFAQNGALALGALPDGAMNVQVKGEDGTYRDCEHDGGETVTPLERHTLSLLIDGSGSMELSYPPSEYGDVCVTCPHDPDRDRIGASAALVRAIHTDSPESVLAIAEFGPDAYIDETYHFQTTILHHGFSTETESVVSSLDLVNGYEENGTPLYDSVGEMIDATNLTSDVDAQKSIVLLSDGLDNESERFELNSVIDFARESNLAVYTVGLGPASIHGIESDTELKNIDAILALQDLATQTGGFYAAANDPGSLQALYDTIATTFTDGYRRERYVCEPAPEPDHDNHDQCGCPKSGDVIQGRMLVGNQTLPWSSIVP